MKTKSRRIEFAQHCQRELISGTRYLKRIIFSDECLFADFRRVDKQNSRVWGTEHPADVHDVKRHSPTIMAGCTVSEHEIIGLYFGMLLYYLMPRLRGYSDNRYFSKMVPLHISLQFYKITWTINFLEGRWGGVAQLRGRRTLRTWPLLAIFLVHIKDIVYRGQPRDFQDLKNKIWQEVRNIDGLILRKVYRKMKTCLNIVMREHAGRFEHLMNFS